MRVRETVWRGDRGDGSIFYRLDRDGKRISPNLYVAYRAEGKEQVKSTLTAHLDEAKKVLSDYVRNKKNADEGIDVLQTPKTGRVTVADLLDANLWRERKHGGRPGDSADVVNRTGTLRKLLGKVRAVDYRPEHTDGYKERRRNGEGTARRKKVGDTAIRHELEILNAAFQYAVKRRVLRYAPFIEKPTEDNVRGKEIPLKRFPAILAALPCPDTRDFCDWLLLTAMRPKGVRNLRWDWFDRETWKLKVPSEKGGDAREFAIKGTLRRVIERRLAVRRLDCPFIFHHDGRVLDARQVRRQFYDALKACGLPSGRAGFTLYDTKKTAAGLLIDSGLSQREAMHFSGHATENMFDRYVIKSSARHGRNVLKRDKYLAKRLADKPTADADKVVVFPKVSGE